nr:MAG TPA: hypothetical protein [Caudoviricetes sp.]
MKHCFIETVERCQGDKTAIIYYLIDGYRDHNHPEIELHTCILDLPI